MPKKSKHKKKNTTTEVRPLVKKTDGQEYAVVTKLLGSCHVLANCYDGIERQCHIRGTMRKREWINVDDIILIALRDFSDKTADVINRYYPDEVKQLKKSGELVDIISLKGDQSEKEEKDDGGFTFEDI